MKIVVYLFALIGLSAIQWGASNQNNNTTYKVGDSAHGGIVFWVSEDGKHGKVCTNKDIAKKAYVMIQEGSKESMDILFLYMNDPGIHDSEGKKYNDWRLPTVKELKLMDINLHQKGLGNFNSYGLYSNYWSSDKDSYEDWMLTVIMGNKEADGEPRTKEHVVRLVRSF